MAKKQTKKKMYIWDWSGVAKKDAIAGAFYDPNQPSLFASIDSCKKDLVQYCLNNSDDGTAVLYEVSLVPVKKVKVVRNDIKIEEVE